MTSCDQYYNCNRWNCNACSTKKLYWLREQSLNFGRLLSGQQSYFTTIKGLSAIENALDVLTHDKGKIKGYNARYNAKKEYFFVISKHERSEWHIHIISNFPLNFPNQNASPIRSLKASCLYLVDNLKRSLAANYGSRRRYGGTSLLYKQNMKNWFKIRIRLWRMKTLNLLLSWLINVIRDMLANKACVRSSGVCLIVACAVSIPLKFSPNKIRPPPVAITC